MADVNECRRLSMSRFFIDFKFAGRVEVAAHGEEEDIEIVEDMSPE